MYKRKRIVIALGGNALGNTLPEQMQAVKTTAKALCDLIEEGHQVVVVHGNGPQVGISTMPWQLFPEKTQTSQTRLSPSVLP